MNYIKLIKSHFLYYTAESSNGAYRTLGIFFGRDVAFGAAGNFLTHLRDPLQMTYGGNVTSLSMEGEVVEITYDLEENSEEYRFISTRSDLIKLLEQWQELMKQKPEVIMITEENGVFAMHGCSYA